MDDNMEPKKKDTYVYVVVDTVKIVNNGTDTDACVEFSDNRNDAPGIGAKFISKVDKGKKITWCGIVKDAISHNGDRVAIKKISRKLEGGGSEILDETEYEDELDNGVVVGKIKDKEKSGTESYDITILVNGKHPYTIDPQLEMIT